MNPINDHPSDGGADQSASEPAGEHEVPVKGAYFVFTLLFLLYTFDYVDRMIVASLFPFMRADWGLTDTQCGLLMSTVYWSITVFAFPVSILVDRWSRKWCIGLMAALWSLATAACAFTGSFRQLFVARFAIGVGEAGYAPGGTAMISALFPERRRALALGIFSAAIPLGAAIGIATGGFVAKWFGWQSAFGLVAVPGMVIALLFFCTRDYRSVRLNKTVDEDGQKTSLAMGKRDIVRAFTGTGSLLLTYVGFAGNTFVTTALLTWLPTYYHRVEGLPEDQAGLKGSAIMLVAVVGAPLGGWLADRWQRVRPNARLLLPAYSSMLSAVVLVVAFGVLDGGYQYVALLCAGITMSAFVPAAAAVTQDVVHPGLRATSYSLCVVVQNLLGSSLGPVFTGAVSDAFDIKTALTILPAFSLLAGLLFLFGSRFYVRDRAKVGKVALEFVD